MKTFVVRLLAAAFLFIGAVGIADAQVFDPKKGRTFVVRDAQGRVVENLKPAPDGFVRLDLTGRRLGRAVPTSTGGLSFYDTSGSLIATAVRGAEPPMQLRLQSIAVIRSTEGRTMGIVAAR